MRHATTRVAKSLVVLTLALILPSCSVPIATADADAQGKKFSPAPGRGAIYVYREGVIVGGAVIKSVSVDGMPLGDLALNTWLRADIDSGRHNVRCFTKNHSDSSSIEVPADQVRFVEIVSRLAFPGPGCGVVEVTPEKGRAAVLAGRRAIERVPDVVVAATPAGLISIIYRDDVTNEITLKGTVRYAALLGQDLAVPFTIVNERAETFCDGTFTRQGPNGGTFTLSCVNFTANGSYERKTGDPNNSFIARGKTMLGYPIRLVIGRPSGAQARL